MTNKEKIRRLIKFQRYMWMLHAMQSRNIEHVAEACPVCRMCADVTRVVYPIGDEYYDKTPVMPYGEIFGDR